MAVLDTPPHSQPAVIGPCFNLHHVLLVPKPAALVPPTKMAPDHILA